MQVDLACGHLSPSKGIYTQKPETLLPQNIRHSWQSVRRYIHGKILDKTYAPGDKLPKDDDIAQTLGCARTTVQRAMRDLVDSGHVVRRRKGGTRVRPDPVTRATFDIPIIRNEVENANRSYGYQLVNVADAVIPNQVATSFGLGNAIEMRRIEAVHLADNRPYIFEDRWVDTRTVPGILDVDLSQQSANEWLVRHHPYSRCEIRFYAVKATAAYARHLNTAPGEALLVMERTTWIDTAPITSVKAVTVPGYQLLTCI
ncbi:MAG: GntR family transcriptional regulator [Paracoccaceae bacterium]